MITLKEFQSRYGLTNKQMAEVCHCSLPTIQKWRSGEVKVSGAAGQLLKYLDATAKGDAVKLREIVGQLEQGGEGLAVPEEGLQQLESSMTEMMDRLELMLENRRQQKQLVESEERYRSMVEAQEDPVCRWKPDTTLTYVNEAYSQMFRGHGKELVGRQWLDFVPAERRAAIEAIVSDIVRRGEVESLEHEAVDADGKEKHVKWTDVPIKDKRGNVVELHSFGRDQTELVRLRREADALERRLGAVMHLSGRALCRFDQNGTLLEANARFEQAIADGRKLRTLAELSPKFPGRQFHQLLSKLGYGDELFYHVQVGDRVLALRGRLVYEGSYRREYVASVEDESRLLQEHPCLRARFVNESVVAKESRSLVVPKERQAALQGLLAELGLEVMVGRVYLFTYDWEGGFMDNVMEWCAGSVGEEMEQLQRLRLDCYPWWTERMRRGQWIKIPDVSKMPKKGQQERRLLEAQGVRAVLAAPVGGTGRPIGFVGFDETENTRIWHSQEMRALELLQEELETVLISRYSNAQ